MASRHKGCIDLRVQGCYVLECQFGEDNSGGWLPTSTSAVQFTSMLDEMDLSSSYALKFNVIGMAVLSTTFRPFLSYVHFMSYDFPIAFK